MLGLVAMVSMLVVIDTGVDRGKQRERARAGVRVGMRVGVRVAWGSERGMRVRVRAYTSEPSSPISHLGSFFSFSLLIPPSVRCTRFISH